MPESQKVLGNSAHRHLHSQMEGFFAIALAKSSLGWESPSLSCRPPKLRK
ncbi:MAG: hypothetical protein LBE38_08435 [Deltaproteobacteria bacterium]|nr:hypothetical protein [Deltaproteobacteria bacterium]